MTLASRQPSGRRPQFGVTAMDLLMGMIIAAIVLALGVPTLQGFNAEQRMKAAVAALHSDLALTRNEAIGRNARVVACPASDSGQCAEDSEWQAGWLVFVDANDDRDWQEGEDLLRRGGPVEAVRITSSEFRGRLRFFPDGSAPGSNASITFCHARGSAAARQLTLSASGRLRSRPPAETDPDTCGS